MPGGCHSNSLLFKARTALAHPPTPYQGWGVREGGLQRESTPAGFLLIGYFSFSLLPCFCFNFLPPPWIASLALLLYCSPSIVNMASHSHSHLLSFFNSFLLFPLYTLWASSSGPPTAGIYLHLTLSVPSSSTSLFHCLVQLFYIVILGPCHYGFDPCTYFTYYRLLVMLVI